MSKHYLTRQIQTGFTLVELLIVVIILAILAAIIVPQFASSTDDAKEAALDTTLSNVRAAIDLYYQQHGEYPGELTAVPGAACPGTPAGTPGTGTGGAGAQGVQAFIDQLSMYTDANGAACSTTDATFRFGPYVKKNTLSKNPITDVATLAVVAAGDLNMAGDGANLGWKYDVLTGKFIANDTTADPNNAGFQYDDR
jgi:prepilin-type N-terminal cleavage/methylation domain-containing protein